MATRGRDLKVNFLTDLDKFDTDDAARGLDTVAEAAQDAGRKLADLDDDTRRGSESIDDVGDQAAKTAEKVDDAFDKIARSSRANLRNKVDDDADKAKRSIDEVGEEAADTGREMAASFSGSADDVMGALQELGANAGAAFGPVGTGLSIALGVGLGAFFADWQKKKEKLKEDVQTFTDALVEGAGRLSEEFLNQQITGIDPEKIRELEKAARDANVPVRDLIRGYAGDPEAIANVTAKLDDAAQKLRDSGIAGAEADPAMAAYGEAVKVVRGELGLTSDALDGAKTAFELMQEAMADPVVPQVDGKPAVTEADNVRQRLEDRLKAEIKVPVTPHASYTASQLAKLRNDIRNQIGTVVVNVRGAATPYANNANNSRYRD